MLLDDPPEDQTPFAFRGCWAIIVDSLKWHLPTGWKDWQIVISETALAKSQYMTEYFCCQRVGGFSVFPDRHNSYARWRWWLQENWRGVRTWSAQTSLMLGAVWRQIRTATFSVIWILAWRNKAVDNQLSSLMMIGWLLRNTFDEVKAFRPKGKGKRWQLRNVSI